MESAPFLRLSPRVFLYAAGQSAPLLPQGGLALAQIPSSAFGDGTHPTTRLCAGAVDVLCGIKPGMRVLDVGTGTGVLARIARARSAERIVATDIDPAALSSARANAALDRASREIFFTTDAPDHWGSQFDLVVANILEEPLRELKPALLGALAPGGTLLLSGFTPRQVPALRVAFAELGGRAEIAELENWALLKFQSG